MCEFLAVEVQEVITYREAGFENIPELVSLRMALLHDAVGEGIPDRWRQTEEQIRAYYEEALTDRTHVAYLAFDEQRCVGTGGICFYRVLPTYSSPPAKRHTLSTCIRIPITAEEESRINSWIFS